MKTISFETVRLPMAALALCGVVQVLPATADEIGQAEYMNYCASCHGETALGDGPVARYINVPVPSLTTLDSRMTGSSPFCM